jgi:hypothetical protein
VSLPLTPESTRPAGDRPSAIQQLRVNVIIAKPNSTSSIGAQNSRGPRIALRAYRTMPTPVSTPLTANWKNSTIAYATQNARRVSSRVRSTTRSITATAITAMIAAAV